MSVRALLLASFACTLALGFSGCRRNARLDTYVDAMAAEYRALEDEYFDLQYDYERKVAELQRLRKQVKQTTGDEEPFPRPAPQRELPPEEPSDLEPPDVEIPDLSPPQVDPGTPLAPGPPEASNQKSGDTSAVARIVLNTRLTGSRDFDDSPGDDGLAVVIEPRGEDNRFVPRPGKVTVVALDPTRRGQEARIARWTVHPEQVARGLETPPAQPGIHLKLGWPRRKPQGDRVHLFVRYETSDGRRLETDQEIPLESVAELSGRWLPRSGEQLSGKAAPGPRLAEAPRRSTGASRPAASPDLPASSASDEPLAAPAQMPAWQPYR